MERNQDAVIYIAIFLVLCSLVFPKCNVKAEETVEITETTVEETEIITEITTEPEFIEFTATAYCPCEKCCGKWAKGRKGAVRGCKGDLLESGKTIAVDFKVISYGSVVVIDGKEYKAVDCGSKIKGNRIDFYFDSHEEAEKFGRQTVYGYIKEDNNEQLPKV